MEAGNKNQESKLKSIYRRRNYFIEEVTQNDLMSKKQKRSVRPEILLKT